MAEIDTIRELHCYEKMFDHILRAVEECEEICQDPVVKEKLIKVQQEVEDIYIGDEYKTHNYLTPDEKVIVLLLTFIREREISKKLGKMNSDIVKESLDWNIALNSVKIELTDEMIEERVKRIFHPEDEEALKH